MDSNAGGSRSCRGLRRQLRGDGPTTRRIGEVRSAGSTAAWWAVSRAGAVLGDARTFGAAVGLVVDAEIEARNEP